MLHIIRGTSIVYSDFGGEHIIKEFAWSHGVQVYSLRTEDIGRNRKLLAYELRHQDINVLDTCAERIKDALTF